MGVTTLMTKIGILIGVAIFSALPAFAQDVASASDPWATVRELEGVWEGEGEGFGQTSRLTHIWEFVLGGKFLRLETRSEGVDASGKKDIHEDVGYVSWSEGEEVLRFRQFLSEGYVNMFRLEPVASPERGINFEPEGTEGFETMIVRMTLRFLDGDTYEMVLELGTKGKTLKPCQTMRLHKVN
jgi:hypothetical protein